MKQYKPVINVLHIEDDESVSVPFHNLLIKRNIYFHAVDNLSEAKNIIKKCAVDIVVADGMFPSKKGGPEKKNFIPFVEFLRLNNINTDVIAWSNSTHVHEFSKKEGISSFSKMPITEERFKEKGREYISVKNMSAFDMVDLLETKLWEANEFSGKISNLKMKEYYSEPATILALSMAYDMRTGLFEQTAGLNYGPVLTKITDGLFTGYLGEEDEAKISKLIYEKILNQNYFPEIRKNVYLRAKKLKLFSKSLRNFNYEKMSGTQLAKRYLEFYGKFMEMRMYSSLPTAMEHLTNPWTELLTEILSKKINDKAELNRALSILTSPEKPSYLNEYQVAAANLGMIKERGEIIDQSAEELAKKYAWVHYTFEGVPISKDDVIGAITEIKKTNSDLSAYIKGFEERPKILKKDKKALVKKYKLNPKEAELFEIGAEIVFIKYFRKGIFAEAYYSVEFLLTEIGRRVGCSKKEVVNMFPNEVLSSLKIGSFSRGLIAERLKNSGMWDHSGMSYPLSYKSAEVYEKYIVKEISVLDIKGQVAYVGKVSGIVKIVNTPDDIQKLKDGEILVSRSTNPSLISAMQRAGAFVTDLGGLTCHAAIVAREMKKPCIVGTKNATKALKDGDMVEVDAEQGIVKIIK